MNRRTAIKNTALMFGYAITAGALTETFISCKNEPRAVNLAWKPEFLTVQQANTLAEMTETILPRTATPGAKDIGVPQFIDKVLKKLLSEAEQKDFVAGLEKLEETCKSTNGKYFDECTPAQREALLLKMDKEAAKFPPNMWGITLVKNPDPITFYRRLKGLTLMAYFTSEKVSKELLVYEPVPGKYYGAVPYKGQNSWSE
jgi:hypothetical protein